MLRLYHTAVSGANIISRGGGQESADESDYAGVSGEAVEKKLFVAPAQTNLAEAIDDSQTEIEVDEAVFDTSLFPVIVCESEKMLITSGFGTTTVTVTRGHNGTTAASHADDTVIINGYEYQTVEIDSADLVSPDESGWVEYAPDSTGSPGSFAAGPITESEIAALASIDYNESVTFWRKITVPASTAATRKTDVTHDIDANAYETELL